MLFRSFGEDGGVEEDTEEDIEEEEVVVIVACGRQEQRKIFVRKVVALIPCKFYIPVYYELQYKRVYIAAKRKPY